MTRDGVHIMGKERGKLCHGLGCGSVNFVKKRCSAQGKGFFMYIKEKILNTTWNFHLSFIIIYFKTYNSWIIWLTLQHMSVHQLIRDFQAAKVFVSTWSSDRRQPSDKVND